MFSDSCGQDVDQDRVEGILRVIFVPCSASSETNLDKQRELLIRVCMLACQVSKGYLLTKGMLTPPFRGRDGSSIVLLERNEKV